jgi:hypothetical protein
MGNELALDVNVICLLTLSLFFVCLVTALAGPVVAGVSYVGLWLYGPRKGRAEMRRARAEALEAKAAAAVAEVEAAAAQAAVSAAEAEIAAAQVRLLREHPELFGPQHR